MVRTPPGTPAWRVKELVTLARCEAVLRAVPSALSLTHEAAAVVQGLAALEAEPDIRVAVPSTRSRMSLPLHPPVLRVVGPASPRSRVSLRRSLVAPAESEIHVVSGLLVTTPLRTALDCAFDLPVRESLPVIDAALRLVCRPDRFTRRCNGEMTLDTARARLVRMVEEQGGRNGKRRARVAVTLADPFAESPGESVLRWTVAVAGLPDPVTQLRWVDVEGHEYYLDLGFETFLVDLEFDGYGKLATPEDLRAEKRREMALRRAGWDVGRTEWKELFSPERLVRRATELIPTRGAADGAAPSGSVAVAGLFTYFATWTDTSILRGIQHRVKWRSTRWSGLSMRSPRRGPGAPARQLQGCPPSRT